MSEPLLTERERALQIVDQISAALNNNNLKEVIKHSETLQKFLAKWTRSDARTRLDDALDDDTLLFNYEAANQHLSDWEGADDAENDKDEVDKYRIRIEERAERKHTKLQVRGVISHCEELWQTASALEHEDQTPRPDFMLKNYYNKVHDIVSTAMAEYSENADLDALMQKAERLLQNKMIAAAIYKTAIEEQRYDDALRDLHKLDAGDLVPRFRVIGDVTSGLTFDQMVTIDNAQNELSTMAYTWAESQKDTMIAAAGEHLQNYQPQAALDVLTNRERVERFVDEESVQALHDLEQQADNALDALEHSERRAHQALLAAQDNALGAWSIYVEAYQTYAGAPSLNTAREAIVNSMAAQMRTLRDNVENAFANKDMEHVRQMCQQARQSYGEKDETLDKMLERFDELGWQAQSYLEYLQNALNILEQLRGVVQQDTNAAVEMLDRLQDYPEMVLEELPELDNMRAMVEHRIQADAVYKNLTELLTSENHAEVAEGITASEDYKLETRFIQLIHGLQLHSAYLNAQTQYNEGQPSEAIPLLEQVVAADGHPDQKKAQQLINQILSQKGDNS